jgi:hypothetical protein
MSSPNVPNEIREEDYVYALEQLMKGRKPGEIRKSLIDAGHPAKQADQIVQYAVKYRNDHQEDGVSADENRQRGKRNMWIGAGIFLLGVVLTVGSFASGGSRVVIAYGAIGVGIVQFLRGAAQSKS